MGGKLECLESYQIIKLILAIIIGCMGGGCFELDQRGKSELPKTGFHLTDG